MIRLFIAILCFVCMGWEAQAQVNIITTVAGNDTQGYCCDSELAITAKLYYPESLWLDNIGNIYIADAGNQRIRKIDNVTGIITTIAGNGVGSYSGDSGLAVNAGLFQPCAVIIDTSGNLYIADAGNNVIRKIIGATNIITPFAGNGLAGSIGDNGPSVNAELNKPCGLYFDKSGNILIADSWNNKIRKVAISTGIITTIAGTGAMGYSGDNGLAVDATLNEPGQVRIDSSGNVIFSDTYNNVVRKIDVGTGKITTIAGTGTGGYFGDHGPATDAELWLPIGLYVDQQQNIFIADDENGAVRKIDAITGIITTVAGTGVPGYSGDHGPATSAQVVPTDIFFNDAGEMFIADAGNNCIRKVSNPTGVASPLPIAIGTLRRRGELAVWPNPVVNELVVSCSERIFSLVICDLLGRVVYSGVYDSKEVRVCVADLVGGVYVVKVDGSGSYREVGRFVKG